MAVGYDANDDFDKIEDDPNATCFICLPLKGSMKCLAILYLVQSILFFIFLVTLISLLSIFYSLSFNT